MQWITSYSFIKNFQYYNFLFSQYVKELYQWIIDNWKLKITMILKMFVDLNQLFRLYTDTSILF